MATQQSLPSPNVDRIAKEAGNATAEAVYQLWASINEARHIERIHHRLSLELVNQPWTTPTYSGATYSSNTGTWTVDAGDVITHRYRLVGKTLELSFVLAATALSGATATQLRITLPEGLVAAARMDNTLAAATEAGVAIPSYIYSAAASPTLTIEKNSGAAWAIAAINVTGQLIVEVQ